MRFITQHLFTYFNALSTRITILIVLSSALLAVQLAAPAPASADCGDPGCTWGTCCDTYCQVFCCVEEQYEHYCMQYCWYCVPECQPCCN